MKKFVLAALLAVAVFNCPRDSHAQQAVGPLNLQVSGAVGNGKALPTAGLNVATVQVVAAGGFDRTITWNISEDGTNYQNVFCRNVTTGVQSVTATASGIYVCNITGGQLFQAPISGGASSGTFTATVTFNQGVADPSAVASGGSSSSTSTTATSPSEGAALFNTSETSAVNTAVTRSIAGVAAQRVHLYTVSAYCSAGSASLTIKDGVAGTTIWVSTATFIGTVVTSITFPVGLTSTTGNGMDITLGACGGGNTGTLQVEADRF